MAQRSLLLAGGAAALVGAALLVRRRRRGGGKRVLIGLTNPFSDDQMRAAESAFSPHSYRAVVLSPEGITSSQPIGLEMATHGALQKMSALRVVAAEDEADEYDLAVACESCVAKAYSAGAGERWIEIFVVVVRDMRTGGEAIATSTGIEIEATLVADWLEGGCEDVVGAALASNVTGGAHTRRSLLAHAYRVAASSLLLSVAEAS